MNEATRKKIRLGEASGAIGVSPKALAHWLNRYRDRGVVPETDKDSGWSEFSLADVAIFAVTARLVDFGMPSPEAFATADDVLRRLWARMLDYKNTPGAALITSLNLSVLIVTRNEGGWDCVLDRRALDLKTPGALQTLVWDAGAILVLNLHMIVAGAFRVLEDMGHETSHLEYGRPVPLKFEASEAK